MNHFDVLNQYTTWAVVGMNDDPEKFAYKIFFKLLEHGKTVYGVNKKYEQIEGHPIYDDLQSVPQPVDVVVFVVNPTIGLHYLQPVKESGAKYLWLQPGTVSDQLLDEANSLGLDTIQNCVLAAYTLMPQTK